MENDERGWKCSTRSTCKMDADILSESLKEIGLMPDRCTYIENNIKMVDKEIGRIVD